MEQWRREASKYSDLKETGGAYFGSERPHQFVPPFCANADEAAQAIKRHDLLQEKELVRFPKLAENFWDMQPYKRMMAVRELFLKLHRHKKDLSLTEMTVTTCMRRVF